MRKANDKYFIELAKERKMRVERRAKDKKEQIENLIINKIMTGEQIKIDQYIVDIREIQSFILFDNDLADDLNEDEIGVVLGDRTIEDLKKVYENACYKYIDNHDLVNKYIEKFLCES